MSINGKGSKRRPETKPGTFAHNWGEINWNPEDKQSRRQRPTMGWQFEQDLKAMRVSEAALEEGAHPFPEPPE